MIEVERFDARDSKKQPYTRQICFLAKADSRQSLIWRLWRGLRQLKLFVIQCDIKLRFGDFTGLDVFRGGSFDTERHLYSIHIAPIRIVSLLRHSAHGRTQDGEASHQQPGQEIKIERFLALV